MNPGKNRCKYLKEVRQRIADENGIPLQQHECTFKGECSGTCPFCDSQLERINARLDAKRQRGETINFDGLKELYKNRIS